MPRWHTGDVRIMVEKVQSGPPHALSQNDVKTILSTVPAEWISDLKIVRLRNSSTWQRVYVREGELVICSRGLPKGWIIRQVLIRLAVSFLGWKRPFERLTRAERAKLDPVIAPFLAELLEALDPPAKEQSISLAGFTEIKFTD